MPAHTLTRLFNLALRGVTLASKFLLIFFLARFLEPAELGLYGLLAATIGYALYLLGLDFYTYTTRELLKRDREEWGGLLKDQGALTLVLYVLFVPLLSLVFATGTLPWPMAGWFFGLIVLEHLNQELMRLLIAISRPVLANVVLFLRQGAWAVIATALMFFDPETRNLETVLLAWTLGGLAALLLAAGRLCQLRIGGWRKRVDWSWIRQGVKVAVPMLVATLAIRGVFTLDRYWLEALSGLEVLGAYVLFMGIGNAMMSFLDAGVFAFLYPGLISAFQKGDADAFRQGVKRFFIQTTVFSLCFALVALVLIDPLLSWLDKPLYREQQGMFPWILLAIFLYALGMIPHYALYAQGRDRPLIHSHIASLVIFIPATWLFSIHWPHLAVPLGLSVAFFLILVWKTTAYFRLTPVQYRHCCPETQAST